MSRNAYADGTMHDLFARYGEGAEWDDLCALFDCLVPLASCMQEPKHHGEGDVATHTKMVVSELLSDPAFAELSADEQFLMFWTAVFHDVGKPARTKVEDGVITSRGHSRAGAMIARSEMMAAGMPFEAREHMCALIAAHQVPFWLYEQDERESRKKAIRLSLELDTRLLVMHARADARGRVCHDPEDIKLRVELSREVFEDLGVYGTSWRFANEESKVAYFIRDDRDPSYEAFETPTCTVTVMSGLPGSGKDTWIAGNMPGTPVVSMDDIRATMKVSATDDQGTVVQKAYEDARVHLRARRDFVWNTTNITFDMRSRVVRLLRDYGARIRMVYLETSPETLMKQNGERKAAVPVEAIMELARKLDPPKEWEAHQVVRVIERPKKNERRAVAAMR
jgi:putative nucleotidyltransferase with HDIG domain